MSTLKTYGPERRNSLLPRPWLDALGAERHIVQGHLFIVAPTKKAVATMLDEAGMADHIAGNLARGAQVYDRDRFPTDWRAAVSAGVIDLDRPGVYASIRGGIVNARIIEVRDGDPVVIGAFAWDSPGDNLGRGRDLIVVPA